MIYGYARVSTDDQTLDAQRAKLTEAGAESREALEAIMSTIDFWAERETGNREFFWVKAPGVG